MARITRRRTNVSLLFLVYIAIGIIVAVQRGYITLNLLKAVLSAVLAVLLWFLVLLGADLRID
jgi:hypothetical protein